MPSTDSFLVHGAENSLHVFQPLLRCAHCLRGIVHYSQQKPVVNAYACHASYSTGNHEALVISSAPFAATGKRHGNYHVYSLKKSPAHKLRSHAFAKLHTYLGMAQILQRKNHVACVSGSLVENICTCPCKRKSSQEKPLHRVIAPCAEPCVWQRKRTCRANGAFSGGKSPSANRANARQNYVGYGLERLRKHSEKNCNATHPQLHAQDIRELPRVRNHVPLRTL